MSHKSLRKERQLFGGIGREKKLRFANRKGKKTAGRVQPKLPKSVEPKISQEQGEQM